ncbi:molybdate ABC transporter substrate-binding protein [Brevibacillus ginsengisoli]|uniref:molybdate ABC transporter substrate-binding protein n=1 Tax=Brevibacillus ginsengisoli TaxID=363854 RepID=UPI003CF6BC03
MFRQFKSIAFFVLLTFSLLLTQVTPLFTTQVEAASSISLKIDGKTQTVSQPPVIINGQTLVPMRDIFEALGAKVTYNPSSKIVAGTKGSTSIELKIGEKTAKIDKKSVSLEVPAQIIHSKTMVPVRFISESLGAKVIWNSHSSTVSIVTPALQNQKAELTISAAASLTDALNELKQSFQTDFPNYPLTFTFGASGKLATQIQQGAPADVFLSASPKEMDTLQSSNLILQSSRIIFAHNQLALVAPKDTKLPVVGFDQLNPASIHQMTMGNPDSVPAGRYGKETLENLKLWDSLKDKVVYGSDVRQVLTYVESGNVDAGIVFVSDALSTDKIKILAIAKPEWHKPIQYPGAVISASKHPAQADVFLDYLNSAKGISILQKHGFYVK